MRMFLIAMCDIFLILYLTGLTKVQSPATLTVDDFYTLKEMHETLKADKDKLEASLQEKLWLEREEKERILAKEKEQKKLADARLKDITKQKEKLESNLLKEKQKVQNIEKSLIISDAERKRINQDLQEKEKILKEREQLLVDLNQKISAKEEARKKMEASYQKDLKKQQKEIDNNRQQAQQFQVEARNAQQLAEQMKQEAAQATKTAKVAVNVQKKALILKEQALKDKEAAEKKAAEALAASRKAEAQKKQALEAMKVATQKKKKAEKKMHQLAATIQDIKQDGETAYTKNILPQVQELKTAYSRTISNETIRYERKMTLLPIKIDEHIVVVLPSQQIGFFSRSDKAPDELTLTYKGQKINHGWINKNDDLIALELPGYKGTPGSPYSIDAPINEFMPVLLALRNNGNMGLVDKMRGLSDNYFIVNRDYLSQGKDKSISYDIKGFRGTGMHGERIIRGDQLIDLKGRLIGVANNPYHVVRINTLSGWDKIDF